MTRYPFPHERLDAWHVARDARKTALKFTSTLPKGFGDEARQINKAAASVVRNICEGAGRFQPGDKIHKFEIATGEACEAAGAVQSLLDCDLGDEVVGRQFLVLEGRTGAMLTGLIRRLRT